MGIFDFLRRSDKREAAQSARAMAGETEFFSGTNDPRLLEFIRDGGSGGMTHSGASITPKAAMKNTTVYRCVSLISYSVGMLPFHLRERETKEKATDHPLFRLLHRRPNAWQTAFEFRTFMQQQALVEGDAYALIVRSGSRITQLVPLTSAHVLVKQKADWSIEYKWQKPGAEPRLFQQGEIFHVRNGLSENGLNGLSLVRQAAEAIGLAVQTEAAAARLFRNGMMVGQVLRHPGKLSPEAYDRLVASMEQREGAENAHRSMVLEEGMEVSPGGTTGKDAQAIEQRKHQIEEIARPFGVPRPFLGMDDTSWGTGIDVLGQAFVRYGLNPWFEAWEQAVDRSLMTDAEANRYEAKFNPGALLRGNMKDQADFFAKALGAGGHSPWMHPAEVREALDFPARDDLPLPLGQQTGASNEPSQTTET
ncbi:phage portal protein [Hoeflea sp.]|uniref:phage portal protein n=1 Tax=Hoeflea sp. TaxID=1940281 RepID=UPI0019956389|nr:phage portal protein [Hoeflea sp.]MBC7285456.1 phage portal protein [Hoeflea sp.]